MRPSVALLALALLAACGEAETARVREDDPALAAALAQPLLVDPDLVALNRANSAAAMPVQDGSLPTIDNGPEEMAAARADALRLVGGPGSMQRAPQPRDGKGLASAGLLTAAERIEEVPGLREFCGQRLQYTALWAAQMPTPFPVYPRGAVIDSAGTDTAGCALRVIAFVTPVPREEVVDFYFTRARAAGYSATHRAGEDDDMLSGSKGATYYLVFARRQPSGNTLVELLTAG